MVGRFLRSVEGKFGGSGDTVWTVPGTEAGLATTDGCVTLTRCSMMCVTGGGWGLEWRFGVWQGVGLGEWEGVRFGEWVTGTKEKGLGK